MLVYKPVGYYNDAEDIIDLFPNSYFKGDEADIIYQYFKDGFGNFHSIDYPDDDSFITVRQASQEQGAIFTSDGMHLVVFTKGSYDALRKGDYCHGYYIDIYALEDAPDFVDPDEEQGVPDPETDFDHMSDDELLKTGEYVAKKMKDIVTEIKRRGLKV